MPPMTTRPTAAKLVGAEFNRFSDDHLYVNHQNLALNSPPRASIFRKTAQNHISSRQIQFPSLHPLHAGIQKFRIKPKGSAEV